MKAVITTEKNDVAKKILSFQALENEEKSVYRLILVCCLRGKTVKEK